MGLQSGDPAAQALIAAQSRKSPSGARNATAIARSPKLSCFLTSTDAAAEPCCAARPWRGIVQSQQENLMNTQEARGGAVQTHRVDLEELANAIARARPDLDPTGERVAMTTYRLLAQGRPVTTTDVAAAAGFPAAAVAGLLDRWPGAWDTLFLPGILGQTARVTSTCPTTGEAIGLLVGPHGVVERSHPGAVVSFLRPERAFDADVVQRFCHFVHFFTDAGAGQGWVATHPGTFLLSLEEAFGLGRLANQRTFATTLGPRR
jgi:hypothetical protein